MLRRACLRVQPCFPMGVDKRPRGLQPLVEIERAQQCLHGVAQHDCPLSMAPSSRACLPSFKSLGEADFARNLRAGVARDERVGSGARAGLPSPVEKLVEPFRATTSPRTRSPRNSSRSVMLGRVTAVRQRLLVERKVAWRAANETHQPGESAALKSLRRSARTVPRLARSRA